VYKFLGENSENSPSNGGCQNDFLNIAQKFSNMLQQNSPAVQHILQQCRSEDGSCTMHCVMEYLVKSPAIRDCLRQTTFHGVLCYAVVHHSYLLSLT